MTAPRAHARLIVFTAQPMSNSHSSFQNIPLRLIYHDSYSMWTFLIKVSRNHPKQFCQVCFTSISLRLAPKNKTNYMTTIVIDRAYNRFLPLILIHFLHRMQCFYSAVAMNSIVCSQHKYLTIQPQWNYFVTLLVKWNSAPLRHLKCSFVADFNVKTHNHNRFLFSFNLKVYSNQISHGDQGWNYRKIHRE